MSVLRFQCQHRYPGGFRLDAAFDVDHRFTALFGPSGSGKTSILNMIAGFLRPQQGTIRLANRTLLDTSLRVSLPPEKRHVGVVFQDSLLFPHLTVEGNLRYGQRRRDKRGRRLDFSRAVDVLEIGPLLRRFPRNLSGGERQRVALGRALLSGPELLLMDEPLASLDAPLRDRVLAYLERAVAEWNIPTLFVTHAQTEVRAAEWVVLLQEGQLLGAGTPDAALSQPAAPAARPPCTFPAQRKDIR
jgi:molybdate transport system ATP-binding protein